MIKNISEFREIFLIYFKKMCSVKQFFLFVFLFFVCFFAMGWLKFQITFSFICIISIPIFIIMNYGLFLFNLKKSNFYNELRQIRSTKWKNYFGIFLALSILTFYIFIITIFGIFLAIHINYLDKLVINSNGIFNLNYGLKHIHYFWYFYSIFFISLISVGFAFMIENFTSNIKYFFVFSLLFFIYIIISDFLIIFSRSECVGYANFNYSSLDNTIQMYSISNFFYYDSTNEILKCSNSIEINKNHSIVTYCFLFNPYAFLTYIISSSIHSYSLNTSFLYQINGISISETTSVSQMYFPHLFSWNFHSYKDLNENIYYYWLYNLLFLITFVYLGIFTSIGMIFEEKRFSRIIYKKKNISIPF